MVLGNYEIKMCFWKIMGSKCNIHKVLESKYNFEKV